MGGDDPAQESSSLKGPQTEGGDRAISNDSPEKAGQVEGGSSSGGNSEEGATDGSTVSNLGEKAGQ